MEEINIPSQASFFPKLPYFQKGQRITNEQLNLLAGSIKGDNALSSVLNAVRIISSNFSFNPSEYEVTATNGVINKNFGRTKFSIPPESVSIIGIDVSSELNGSVYSVKLSPGVVILDYMTYVFSGVTIPLNPPPTSASLFSGVFVFAFSEILSDEDYNQFLNLDTDKIVKTKYMSKKTYQMKLFHIPIFNVGQGKFNTTGIITDKQYDSIDLLLEDVTPQESFPICGYTIRDNVLLLRNLFKNMPLFPTPDYITTMDVLGKWVDMGDSFSLVMENGDRVLKSLSGLNLKNILPVNSIVRLNKLLYRKVVKSIDDFSVQLDRGYYIPDMEISRELLVKMPVEKAISLENVINGEVAKYEIGEIKYLYSPSQSRNWLRLSSKTRILKKQNYPDFVPYLYNYPLMTTGTFSGGALSSAVFTEWVDKFELNSIARNKDNVTIYLTVNDINKRILQALMDDHATRKYIDPVDFMPRTVTIGENPISMDVFKLFPNLSPNEISMIQKTASWNYFLKWLYLEPGTYPISNIDLVNYSISIMVPSDASYRVVKYEAMNLNNSIEYKSEALTEIKYSNFPNFYLENIYTGANYPTPLNLKGSLIQFFPHRLPTFFTSGSYNISSIKDSKVINGNIETQQNPADWIEASNSSLKRVATPSSGVPVEKIFIANPDKFRLTIANREQEALHVSVPGNGYRSTVLPNGTLTNGGYEGVVGAINGWEKYVVPGYAHIFIGNYIEE